ncbi:Oleosin 5 [Abeliophyllum distichum]|uniref:Oleosin 5 n=1 Tax=Abeliophyllum distichum TaxID=126358 RepID=A0ABD1VTC7_9LAMI
MAEYHQQQQTEKGRPSTSQVLAVVILFPVGGILLCLSGLTLAGSLIGLALATPVFVICSPVLVPAVLTIGLAVVGFLTSGAFGITALSSLSWLINYMRRVTGTMPEQFEHTKRSVQDTAGQIGQKARETGQKAQDVTRP